jgi:hypothetical protein
VGNEAPIPCQQPPLRSAVHAWPNPSTQLGWKDCAVLLHSPKAERHSFTNQSPLSTTAHHPQSGATFEGLHGVSSFSANPFLTQSRGIRMDGRVFEI